MEAEIEDAELVRRIIAGDESGFELLVRRYGGRMLAVARRITGNEADAHDCLQESLIKCFTSMDQFEGRSGLGTWLHRIVVNVSLMRLRSQSRSREDSLDELQPEFDPMACPRNRSFSADEVESKGPERTLCNPSRFRRTIWTDPMPELCNRPIRDWAWAYWEKEPN